MSQFPAAGQDNGPAAPVPNPETTQLLMAGFTPTVAIGVNLVNMCTDAIYLALTRFGIDVNTMLILLLFSILFGAIVFLLDKVTKPLRYIFFVFNALTILYFGTATNTWNKFQSGPDYVCHGVFFCTKRIPQ